ncbi:hypothetical protein GCM10010172_15800 [Paractinoplanes ferrugineus]|uniref:HEXXH motif-containing protein n=1 Tax=Paractinoplanes ferrugineus TaxID=113564 RepID=A0A919MD30_9ACTN|nr:HEXXH motif-containing putative peptide modification protein [Actinoplanes ferrugineus]GIE10144.1 hypothetical protein Afe05nite_19840 [Actinoplanes ferrugineus]
MREYALTDHQFRSLAEGGGSPDAIDLLAEAQLSGRRLRLLAIAENWDALPPALQDALSLVIQIDQTSPQAGLDLLRYPFLGACLAPLLAALPAVASRDQQAALQVAEQLGSLAAATAIAAGIPFEIVLTCSGRDLVLPRIGTAIGVGPAQVRVQFDGAIVMVGQTLELSIPADEPRCGWRPAHLVRLSNHTLEIVDTDPLRARFPEPPRDAFSSADRASFDRLVRDAWQILDDDQPEHVRAMRTALRALVPLRTPADAAQVSASVRGCFGAIGISVPGDPEVMAELLVHEFQHEKLGALLDLVDLCSDSDDRRYHAPWRPDARPAKALVQGVYAFAGVAGFWRARRSSFRYYSWREHVSYALDQLLGSGELTPVGVQFFRGLDATLASWRSEDPTPPVAQLHSAALHVAWRLTHYRPASDDIATIVATWPSKLPANSWAAPAVAESSISSEPAGLLDGRGAVNRDGTSEAERAILNGEPAYALSLLPSPGSDREWTAAAVALYSREGQAAIAYRRPDVLRAVFEQLEAQGQRPDLVALHTWLGSR